MSAETRDEIGRVLCCHGRPIQCYECGEDYAAELNAPTPAAPSREEREADDRVVGMLVERCKRVFKTGKTCREGDGPFGYCVNCLASAEIERLKAARPSRADCERALELAQSSARAGHRSWLMRRASKMADARRLLQLDPTPMDDK